MTFANHGCNKTYSVGTYRSLFERVIYSTKLGLLMLHNDSQQQNLFHLLLCETKAFRRTFRSSPWT
jgi:hypothetical protein